MCDVCRVFAHQFEFDCPQVKEWPDHPWDKETRIREDHDMARFRRNNPELAERTMDKVAEKTQNCNHESHHKMAQDWQGVGVLCRVCNRCGKTVNLFQEL